MHTSSCIANFPCASVDMYVCSISHGTNAKSPSLYLPPFRHAMDSIYLDVTDLQISLVAIRARPMADNKDGIYLSHRSLPNTLPPTLILPCSQVSHAVTSRGPHTMSPAVPFLPMPEKRQSVEYSLVVGWEKGNQRLPESWLLSSQSSCKAIRFPSSAGTVPDKTKYA